MINDAAEFALWLSPHILSNVAHVLSEALGLDGKHIEGYIQVLTDLAFASGGGLTDPPQTVGDCPDWEDNRILDLAIEVGAWVMVSADIDLPQCRPGAGGQSSSQASSPRLWTPPDAPAVAPADRAPRRTCWFGLADDRLDHGGDLLAGHPT